MTHRLVYDGFVWGAEVVWSATDGIRRNLHEDSDWNHDPHTLEDHATVACATQNFMQSLAEDGDGRWRKYSISMWDSSLPADGDFSIKYINLESISPGSTNSGGY